MIELDWAKFEILNKKYANAFETLCLHLFSRYVHTECIGVTRQIIVLTYCKFTAE